MTIGVRMAGWQISTGVLQFFTKETEFSLPLYTAFSLVDPSSVKTSPPQHRFDALLGNVNKKAKNEEICNIGFFFKLTPHHGADVAHAFYDFIGCSK